MLPPVPPTDASTDTGALRAAPPPSANLSFAIAAGAAAALAGALVWATVTYATKYQIGWMAVGIGFLVGFAVRKFGRGQTPVFGFVGAALALVGCVLGNVFTLYPMIAHEYEAPIMNVIQSLGPADLVKLMKVTSGPMDVLFYGIALYYGYRTSFTAT